MIVKQLDTHDLSFKPNRGPASLHSFIKVSLQFYTNVGLYTSFV